MVQIEQWQKRCGELCQPIHCQSTKKTLNKLRTRVWQAQDRVPICETSQIQCLMGRRPMKDVLGNHLKDRLYLLVHWLSIFLSFEEPVKNPSIWKDNLTNIVPRTRIERGRSGKGDVPVTDLEELETMDASEIHSKKLNAKEVMFPKQGEFTFPIADGRIKTHGGDQDLRTSTLVRHRPIQGKSKIDFLGALNPESNFTRWEKNHCPFHQSTLTLSRTAQTNLDVKQEKRTGDYWNIDGSQNLSDPWRGFTQFTPLDEKTPDGYVWSGERLTRKQLASRPDHLWPELWKSMGKHAKLKEKQKWSNEKLHLKKRTKIARDPFHRPGGQGI